MLRVPVHKIEPGMSLARPIPLPNEPHRFLLQRDCAISADMIPRLKELGIMEVWIRYPDLEFLEERIDEEVDERQREVYGHVRRNFEQFAHGTNAEMDIAQFESSISGLFDSLKQSQHGNVLLQKLGVFDNYLMSHSTNVCYLTMLLGIKIERYIIEQRTFKSARDAKDLQLLGLGCLLHDVGKMRVPVDILNKPGPLTCEEMELMKLHTVYGHEMVKGRVPPAAAEIVLNHHQRWNGEGYPTRVNTRTGEKLTPLSGKQITVFNRIATVVDVYDAATSTRVYSAAKLPVQVLYEMRTWCSGFFDPVVEQAFYEIIPPFPIGQIVKLSNGIEAAVVDFNPRFPFQPKVQGIRDPKGWRFPDPALEEFDLALYDELEIVSVDDVDVRPYLDSQNLLPQLV